MTCASFFLSLSLSLLLSLPPSLSSFLSLSLSVSFSPPFPPLSLRRALRVAVVDKSKSTPKFNTRTGEVFLHPACLDAGQEASLDSNIIVYHEIVKTAKVYVRDATTISPYALLLFGGQIHVQHQSNKIVVDNWLSLTAAPKVAVLVKQLKALLDRLLERKIVNPHETLSSTDEKVVSSIMMLFETEPQLPPGDAGKGPPAAAAGGGMLPGDWKCVECGSQVFASKRNCFKCGAPKR